MSLLLPLLFLGLAQPAEQPPSISSASAVQQSQTSAESGFVSVPRFTEPNPFNAQSLPRQVRSPRQTPNAKADLCYTMRSYIFERSDAQAPEMVGMTTCQPARTVTQKHVMARPKLVPAR